MKMKTQQSKICGTLRSNPKREIHSITGLSQKIRKAQTNNLTLHLKKLEKEQQTKPKVSRRKEIIKFRAEINEIESKKQYKRSMNLRACS